MVGLANNPVNPAMRWLFVIIRSFFPSEMTNMAACDNHCRATNGVMSALQINFLPVSNLYGFGDRCLIPGCTPPDAMKHSDCFKSAILSLSVVQDVRHWPADWLRNGSMSVLLLGGIWLL